MIIELNLKKELFFISAPLGYNYIRNFNKRISIYINHKRFPSARYGLHIKIPLFNISVDTQNII